MYDDTQHQPSTITVALNSNPEQEQTKTYAARCWAVKAMERYGLNS
jgi:hypothetical protein